MFPGRLALQQRVLPSYRTSFFDGLAQACEGGLSLFAGQPRPDEGINPAAGSRAAQFMPARNLHVFRGRFYLCYQFGVQDWLDDWDPDALIVEANPRYLSTPAAIRWMKRRGRPVLGWGLGARMQSGLLSGVSKKLWVDFLKQFEALIAYSRRGADEYARLGFSPEKISVAPNAVAPRPVHGLPARPGSFVERPILLFVGRLQDRKRVDLLLQACALLGSAVQPRLIVIGDGPARSAMEELAKKIYPPAEFIGPRHGDELIPFYTAADLFVLPGTGGLAVQEAMAYGLPVVVAAGDGTQEDLVHPGNGWQIPPGDLNALVETLRLALSDVSRLRAMGEESYRIVSGEVNLEKMVSAFVEALNTLRL